MLKKLSIYGIIHRGFFNEKIIKKTLVFLLKIYTEIETTHKRTMKLPVGQKWPLKNNSADDSSYAP